MRKTINLLADSELLTRAFDLPLHGLGERFDPVLCQDLFYLLVRRVEQVRLASLFPLMKRIAS